MRCTGSGGCAAPQDAAQRARAAGEQPYEQVEAVEKYRCQDAEGVVEQQDKACNVQPRVAFVAWWLGLSLRVMSTLKVT